MERRLFFQRIFKCSFDRGRNREERLNKLFIKVSAISVFSVPFLLGLFSSSSQILIVRELLASFPGNELIIALILSTWLFSACAGGLISRLPAGKNPSNFYKIVIACFLFGSSLLLFQIIAARSFRLFANIALGETPALLLTCITCFVCVAPLAFCVGLAFPYVSSWLASRVGGASAIPIAYSMESAGAVFSGVVVSLVFFPLNFSHLRLALIVISSVFFAISIVCHRESFLKSGYLFSVAFIILLLSSFLFYKVLNNIDAKLIFLRLPKSPSSTSSDFKEYSHPHLRLVTSVNTPYQVLDLVESHGQFILYGNGSVLATAPDTCSYEHFVHFVMAQNPEARHVLLLGGIIGGEGHELLKYPIERLVHVSIDPSVNELMAYAFADRKIQELKDKRLEMLTEDAFVYVKSSDSTFDAIILRAPDPLTSSANRFYTKEFYSAVSKILNSNGIFYVSVSSSEMLGSHASALAASVYTTLKSVFENVKVTYGNPTQFFASKSKSTLTFDREALFSRFRSLNIKNTFFRPEYFLVSEEIDDVKTKWVCKQLAKEPAMINTIERPITYLLNLRMWCSIVGPNAEKILETAEKLLEGGIVFLIPLLGGMFIIFSGVFLSGYSCSIGSVWTKLMAILVLFICGGVAVAFELVVIYSFQTIAGDIYSKIGLLFASFMAGLWFGGHLFCRLYSACISRIWIFLFCAVFLIVNILLFFPSLLIVVDKIAGIMELILYVIVFLTAFATGFQFSLISAFPMDPVSNVVIKAGLAESTDLFGAAIGSFLVGVFLIPMIGIRETCTLLASFETLALCCVLSAMIVSRRRV